MENFNKIVLILLKFKKTLKISKNSFKTEISLLGKFFVKG